MCPPTFVTVNAISNRLLLLVVLCFLTAGSIRADVPGVRADEPVFRLDEIGNYRVGFQRRGEGETDLPLGWTGGLDSPTGAACQPYGNQNGRSAWLLHCPWKGKTGVTFQEYTVALPPVAHISLRGATALRSEAVGKSDGVVCRVFVNGEKRFEANRKDDTWLPFDLDLSPDSGKTVTLRFESGPGPNDNASFDFSLWSDRRLEMPELMSSHEHCPEPPPLKLGALTSRENGAVVPLSGFQGKTAVQVGSEEARLSYEGADGTLEYRWQPNKGDSILGNVTLHAWMTGDKPAEIPLAGEARLDWTASAQLKSSRLVFNSEKAQPQAVLTRGYDVGGQAVTVTVVATMQEKSLVLDVTCDQPAVRAFDGGGWGPVPRRRTLRVPYYSSPILFMKQENIFTGVLLDWTASQASSHNGTRAVYEPRTDGSRVPLRERLVYTAAWHLAETLPNIPNPPSPFRGNLSQGVVLDIWGGRFADVQARLRTLAQSGFEHDMVILHDWQFGGYDNKLPQHFPANADLGGDPAMVALAREAENDHFLLALHENYVDDYPNAPNFAETDLSRNPDGTRTTAWLNEGTHVQSFGIKPNRILPLAKIQGEEIRRRYATGACYLDVHSAVPPWFHVDFEAGQVGAGRFDATWNAHRELWAYERELHHGPVFGEGNNHWYWSGLLDGVEAQFGQGWPDSHGTEAPLLVDFDLLKIHPLQLNHGMGYYERWWPHGPDARRDLLSLLDQYRVQEVAYGHQGFLGGEVWHDPGCAWLESHLLPPLTERTALANPSAIEYRVGDRWLDTSAAVRANADFSQVRVRYDNGLTICANGSDREMTMEGGGTLPPFGWTARGTGFNADTTRRQNVLTDFVRTPESVFVNARPAVDWRDRGVTRVRPFVAEFTPLGARRFRASYRWAVGQTLPTDLMCFVHFDPARADAKTEDIRFQQDHAIPLATSQWKTGQDVTDGPWEITVPEHVASGDYLWTIGLHGEGGRRTLLGLSDPHRRRILGTLHLAADGGTSFTSAEPGPNETVAETAPVIDFGDVRTDGSVFVRLEGREWILRPFPVDRAFTVQLRAAFFGAPVDAKVEDGWWQLPLTGQPTYRWPASAR